MEAQSSRWRSPPQPIHTPKARIAFLLSAVLLTALALGLLWPLGAAEARRTHTVVIEAMAFTPVVVRARPGDHIRFENRDVLPHTATGEGRKSFDSGPIEAGRSWTLEVPEGHPAISYVCLYHPTMKARIVVESQ